MIAMFLRMIVLFFSLVFCLNLDAMGPGNDMSRTNLLSDCQNLFLTLYLSQYGDRESKHFLYDVEVGTNSLYGDGTLEDLCDEELKDFDSIVIAKSFSRRAEKHKRYSDKLKAGTERRFKRDSNLSPEEKQQRAVSLLIENQQLAARMDIDNFTMQLAVRTEYLQKVVKERDNKRRGLSELEQSRKMVLSKKLASMIEKQIKVDKIKIKELDTLVLKTEDKILRIKRTIPIVREQHEEILKELARAVLP